MHDIQRMMFEKFIVKKHPFLHNAKDKFSYLTDYEINFMRKTNIFIIKKSGFFILKCIKTVIFSIDNEYITISCIIKNNIEISIFDKF